MMGLKCGLDELFLAAFATKMATKSPMERRGMLLLDEIQIRKELAVNSKTMTYFGYVDHEQEDGDCKELAHYVLVFAFEPFADSYLQSAAVFCVKRVRRGGNDFQVIKDAVKWLDTWEEKRVSENIHKNFYLTPFIAERLK
ncbi:hypothetical protein HPB47_002026, partial [Ixodes persulcatus]